VSADPSLLVFGHLATPAHLAEQSRKRLSGLYHGARIEPGDPSPGEAVSIVVDAGAASDIVSVRVRYTTDGPTPTGSAAAVAARRVETRWDDLAWRYVDRWVAVLPSQSDGTQVRYTVEGLTENSDTLHYADADRSESGPTVFGYNVDRLSSPDWIRDAVIYQIFVDRFFHTGEGFGRRLAHKDEVYGGTLGGVRNRLDYLSNLGVNTLWLTPIFESETYHGYDGLDFTRVADRVGGPQALRGLVEEAHRRGIRILLDLALNHCSWHSPAFLDARQREESPFRDWFTFEEWPDRYASFFGSQYLPELNTRNPDVVRHLCDIVANYLAEFDVDGYRLDYALGPSLLFWSTIRTATKAAKSDAYTVGEATTGPGELRRFEGRLDGCLDFPLLQLFRQFFLDGSLDAPAFHSLLSHHDRFFDADFSRPTFLDNHDMNRFLWSAGGDARKLKLAAVCQFTLPQPPIIYYGTEVGLSQEEDVRQIGFAACRLPMVWDDQQDGELLEFYRTIVRVRLAHPALRRGRRKLIEAADGVYAFHCEHEADRVVVVLNRSDEERVVSLPGTDGVDVLSGRAVIDSIRLAPMGAALIECVR